MLELHPTQGLDMAQGLLWKPYLSCETGAGCSWVIPSPKLSGGVRAKSELFYSSKLCDQYIEVHCLVLWLLSRSFIQERNNLVSTHCIFTRYSVWWPGKKASVVRVLLQCKWSISAFTLSTVVKMQHSGKKLILFLNFKWQWQIVPFFVSVQFTSLPREFCWWCRAKSKYLKCSLLVCREVAWQNWKYMNLMVYLKHSSFFAILLSLDLWWNIWVLGYRTVHCIINTSKATNFKCWRTHLWAQDVWFFSSFQYLIQ